MLIDIKMPALGMAQSTGTIIEWVKKVGDEVIEEETIVRIETDKSVMDLPSPSKGILKEILAEIGVPINIGVPIASIETAESDSHTNTSKNKILKGNEKASEKNLDEDKLDASTNLQNNTHMQEQKQSDTSTKAKSYKKKEDRNVVENMKLSIHSQTDKSLDRILASPLAKILANNKQIKITDLISDTNLKQPYDSSDVYKFINNNSRVHADSQWIKGRIDLEKFNQLCHINNDSNHNEILRLELFYKICLLVVDDILSSINSVNNDSRSIILRVLKDFEWKHYMYSKESSKLEETCTELDKTSTSHYDIVLEFVEDTSIIDLKLTKHSKLCISLVTNIENHQSILKIDSNFTYIDEHLTLTCMKNLVRLLEYPLLLLI